MAIPVYLQQFKAAGVYRVVFDKSVMVNVNSEILRLVVGYSESGPFNIPTYVTNVAAFKTLYGDISKKLEKRGIWFHRMALQALAAGPILCLNLKKFENEKVGAATIDTKFNPVSGAIDVEELKLESIYDTSRFWELSAEKLNNARTVDGSTLDKYINICTTDVAKNSATYFIRKATSSIINNYKVTISDWYSDGAEAMPEYLEGAQSTLVSDYMAEIYVFKGKFTKEQVLASTSLKQHFTTDENGDLVLRKYELDAFGDPIDPLQALYEDETSGALGHYVGSLIPYMKNKQGQYISLDIIFNEDQNVHSMMMSLNTDLLEDEEVDINISGKNNITDELISNICDGSATVTMLGNNHAEIVADTLTFSNNIDDSVADSMPFEAKANAVRGALYVSDKSSEEDAYSVTFKNIPVDEDNEVIVTFATEDEYNEFVETLTNKKVLGADETVEWTEYIDASVFNGKTIITSLKNIKLDETGSSYTIAGPIKVSTIDIETTIIPTITAGHSIHTHVYDPSLSFINVNTDNWEFSTGGNSLICLNADNTLTSAIGVGDAFIADVTDVNGFHKEAFVVNIETIPASSNIWFAKKNNVSLETLITGLEYEALTEEEKEEYIAVDYTTIDFTEKVYKHSVTDASHSIVDTYVVRLNADICRENGMIYPQYLQGYTYEHSKPVDTGMLAKLNWQNDYMLAALTDYKGLRTGLLNKSDIDYRYIIDTFETYVDGGAKKVLSYLAKQKQSAFAILNFPSVKTFVKCPYASYVDNDGVFNVQYIVDGYNKKKAHSKGFSLPSDDEGASFCAFYTPLKFSDGYVDNVVPSAALVSNLFMQKYLSRKPYYIIAGPNYGSITASGLVGPDYNYSQEELNIIEPYGVNCMVYRPSFGTFINANQTAKQTPVSALSRVNVRELVIYLQDEIERVLQSYQWEFNTPLTRNAILDRANTICANIQANGGIQAFKNVMDDTNNTPEIIDNEMAILSTHIEPGFGCGKMVQELTIYKTGGLSASISD